MNKTPVKVFAAALLLAGAGSAMAEVHYVDVNCTNAAPPYTDWSTAATNIQDAVDAALAGDEIVVTNGIYQTGRRLVGQEANRVVVDKPLSVRSVNRPQFTTIYGFGGLLGRCVYLTNGASLSGFTVTRGQVNAWGGGAYGGTLNNCALIDNRSGTSDGGGAASCTLNNCTLSANRAFSSGGGAVFCTLNNCTLIGNRARTGGGVALCTLNNCTLADNAVSTSDGELTTGGAANCLENNSIHFQNIGSRGCEDCGSPGSLAGNNWYGDPLFVDQANGNLRLQFNSPCVNAGDNAHAVGGTDLDGNPRIVRGTVDIGAYEFQASVRYVDVNGTNATPPYTNWATAATNIQDAVDAAAAGDEIVVTNGAYYPNYDSFVEATVTVTNSVSVRSVNGPLFTWILGCSCENYKRCVSMTTGASLSGFTLSDGYSWGYSGGAAMGGTLNNCTLNGNYSRFMGGGAYSCTLNSCTITGNSAGDSGGGAAYCTLNNCTITGNESYYGGYGSGGAVGSTLNNCIAFGNHYRVRFPGGDVYFCEDCASPGHRAGNNWSGDPLFVDTNGWANLRLRSNSPCLNAGNNTFVTSATDLDGLPRIVGGTVDIGAYEFQSLDLIGSGVVSNQFGFLVTGQSNWVIVLEVSSDFANWTPLTTNTLSGRPFPFSDSTPPYLPQRLYRARQELP